MRRSFSPFLLWLIMPLLCGLMAACTPPIDEPDDDEEPDYNDASGFAWMFDTTTMPQFHIEVPLDEWNALLDAYDRNHDNRTWVHCDVRCVKGNSETLITDAGIRLRGNTSRRRPEKGSGHHTTDKARWQHCHLSLGFSHFNHDASHTVHGMHRVDMKWFKDDPTYVREVFCYDLYHRFGIWTAPYDVHSRLWLHVAGDSHETYCGVYGMLEHVDEHYLHVRRQLFGRDDGFLWKGAWGCTLASTHPDTYDDTAPDAGSTSNHAYTLKTGAGRYPLAKAQLTQFITRLNKLQGEEFHDWIATVCDVRLLLRTYAVNVAVGMWDDYWNNCNNCYFYFTPPATNGDGSVIDGSYRFYFIPFDYDNTLGTTYQCGRQSDAARQNPLQWGSDSNPLIAKLLRYDDYRAIYVEALRELVADGGLCDAEVAAARIREWQQQISAYVANDTGEDNVIADRPASWSSHTEYRLLDPTPRTNYFRVKKSSIDALK